MKIKYLLWLMVGWLVVVGLLFIADYRAILIQNREMALSKARAFFELIVQSRIWNSDHGGVYVPVTETSQPNVYLVDSLRDVVTIDGLKLTKINPAYMTRQISEITKSKEDTRFHITSLKPIRPQNEPDDWEAEMLKLFETGKTSEQIILTSSDNVKVYRYMAPLVTQASCLKCHVHQGYKTGDIRGGISVTFPAEVFQKALVFQVRSFLVVQLLIAFFGTVFLFFYHRLAKKYNKVIEAKNAELFHSIQIKDRLFQIIAHDLRSPFAHITGVVGLINSDDIKLDTERRNMLLHNLEESTQSASRLLENLLQWANSQQNKLRINREGINVLGIVSLSIEPYNSLADAKKLKTVIDISPDVEVVADKYTLGVVISNLYNNAVKYSYEEGTILISSPKSAEGSVICIEDQGTGMPANVLSTLFSVENVRSVPGTRNEKGTGIGLLVCKEFIDLNGGSIAIESTVGKGTKVFINLPDNA